MVLCYRFFIDFSVKLIVVFHEINLQEADIIDVDTSEIIGSVVVDIRGHHVLTECS